MDNNYKNSYFSTNRNNDLEYYNSKVYFSHSQEQEINSKESIEIPSSTKKFNICLIGDNKKSIQSRNIPKPQVRFSFNQDSNISNNDKDNTNILYRSKIKYRKSNPKGVNTTSSISSDDDLSYYENFGGKIKKSFINTKNNYFKYQENDYLSFSSSSSSSFSSNNKVNEILNNSYIKSYSPQINSSHPTKKSYKILSNGNNNTIINQTKDNRCNKISNHKNKNSVNTKIKSIENNIITPYNSRNDKDNSLVINTLNYEEKNENERYDEKNQIQKYSSSSLDIESPISSNSTNSNSLINTEYSGYTESESLVRLEKILNYKLPRLSNFNELKLKYNIEDKSDINGIDNHSSDSSNKNMKESIPDKYNHYIHPEERIEDYYIKSLKKNTNNKKSDLIVTQALSNHNKYYANSLNSKSSSSSFDNSNYDNLNSQSKNNKSSILENIEQKKIRTIPIKDIKNNKKINNNNPNDHYNYNYNYKSYNYNDKYYNGSESDKSLIISSKNRYTESSENVNIQISTKGEKLKNYKNIKESSEIITPIKNENKNGLNKIRNNEASLNNLSSNSSFSSYYSSKKNLVVKEKRSLSPVLVKSFNSKLKSTHSSNSKSSKISKNGYYLSNNNEFYLDPKDNNNNDNNNNKNNKKLYKTIKKYLDKNKHSNKDVVMIILNDKSLEGNKFIYSRKSSSSSISSSSHFIEKKHKKRKHHHQKKSKYSSEKAKNNDKQSKNTNKSKSSKKENKKVNSKKSKNKSKNKSKGHHNLKDKKESVLNYIENNNINNNSNYSIDDHNNNNDNSNIINNNNKYLETKNVKENDSRPSFILNSSTSLPSFADFSSVKPVEIPKTVIEGVSYSKIEIENTPNFETKTNQVLEEGSPNSYIIEKIPRSFVDMENSYNESHSSDQSSTENEETSFIISEEKVPELLSTSPIINPIEIRSRKSNEPNEPQLLSPKMDNINLIEPIEIKTREIPIIELTLPSDENTNNSNISMDSTNKSFENKSLSLSLNDKASPQKLEDLILEVNESSSEAGISNPDNINSSHSINSFNNNKILIDNLSDLSLLRDNDVSHIMSSVPSCTDIIIDEDNDYLSDEIITESDSINMSKSLVLDYVNSKPRETSFINVNEESKPSKACTPSIIKYKQNISKEELKSSVESTDATKINSSLDSIDGGNSNLLLKKLSTIEEIVTESTGDAYIENYQVQANIIKISEQSFSKKKEEAEEEEEEEEEEKVKILLENESTINNNKTIYNDSMKNIDSTEPVINKSLNNYKTFVSSLSTIPLIIQHTNNEEIEDKDVDIHGSKSISENESENVSKNKTKNESENENENKNKSKNNKSNKNRSKESLEISSSSNTKNTLQSISKEIKLDDNTIKTSDSILLPSVTASPNALQPKPKFQDQSPIEFIRSPSPIRRTRSPTPIRRTKSPTPLESSSLSSTSRIISPNIHGGQSFKPETERINRRIDISKFISSIRSREESLKAKENEFLKVIDEETEKNRIQKDMIRKTSDELDDKIKEVRQLAREVSKHKKILLEQKEANNLLQEELEEEKKQALYLQQQLDSQYELNSKQEQEISYFKEIHNMYLEENQRLQALLLKLTNTKTIQGISPLSMPSLTLPPPTSPSISVTSSPKNTILSPVSSVNTLI